MKFKTTFTSALILAASASPLAAQDSVAPMQVQRMQQSQQAVATLPANTTVQLRMNQEITTKGRTWSEGDTFNLTVAHHIFEDGYLVIPEGSRAVGRITYLTNKGMFGKSGKMEIELEHIEVAGRRIAIEGGYRQEGEGNTVATIATSVLVLPIAGMVVTGRSATIPRGRELTAYTTSDIPLALQRGRSNDVVPASLASASPDLIQQ